MASTHSYPTCARHSKARKDTRLRDFFLCDGCADQWTHEAFSGAGPVYSGEVVHGYCLLCNVLQGVRLRQWFLCDICDRVARSIGRNHVAEQGIMDWWAAEVQPRFGLNLFQNDASVLLPRGADAKSGVAEIDFLIKRADSVQAIASIENKTGRSAIPEMSQFQLDLSDCDCIKHSMDTLSVPAFLIHAQVLEVWLPPTVAFFVKGLWWSDVYAMAENFAGIKVRRDENRGAAYFKRHAFRRIETFADALMGDSEVALVERFRREGTPHLYRR